jgi:hypothetical protein
MKNRRSSGFDLTIPLIVLALAFSGCMSADQETTTTTVRAQTPTTSTTSSTSTTIATTSTSTTTTSSTTTTTLPRFVQLSWDNLEKCKETILGMMNSVIIDVPPSIEGAWNADPADAFTLSCDGSKEEAPDKVVYRGGNTINQGNPITGQYRLMIKCGHNAKFDNLKDCKELNVTLDRAALNLTATGPES